MDIMNHVTNLKIVETLNEGLAHLRAKEKTHARRR
jgi:hypothetical protein